MRERCQTAQAIAERGEVPELLTKATWRRDGAFSAQLCERAVDVMFKSAARGGTVRRAAAAARISRRACGERAHLDDVGAAGDDVRPRRARVALRQSDPLA